MAQIPKGRLVKGPYKPIPIGTVPSTFNYCNRGCGFLNQDVLFFSSP